MFSKIIRFTDGKAHEKSLCLLLGVVPIRLTMDFGIYRVSDDALTLLDEAAKKDDDIKYEMVEACHPWEFIGLIELHPEKIKGLKGKKHTTT